MSNWYIIKVIKTGQLMEVITVDLENWIVSHLDLSEKYEVFKHSHQLKDM